MRRLKRSTAILERRVWAQSYAFQLTSATNTKMDTLHEDLVHFIVVGDIKSSLDLHGIRLLVRSSIRPGVRLSVRLPVLSARLPVEIFR